MTVAAGAPNFAALIECVGALSSCPTPWGMSPFDVVDAVAREVGEEPVQSAVSDLYASPPLRATPELKAIAHARSGLVLTTNYDLAIEKAADTIGRPVRTLQLADLQEALHKPGQELRVLHLHGVTGVPGSIVLTKSSYEEIFGDDRTQLLLRGLGACNTFVFLGHSLDPREGHIRRDLKWITAARLDGSLPHLLVKELAEPTDPTSLSQLEELASDAGLDVYAFHDPGWTFQATRRVANAIAGPSPLTNANIANTSPQVWGGPYVPLPMGETGEVGSPMGMGAFLARSHYAGAKTAVDLDGLDRLLIIAPGGSGKSVELAAIERREAGASLRTQLSRFDVTSPMPDQIQRFVSCMRDAEAAHKGTLRLTEEGLRYGSYTFLLDALDEAPAAHRSAIVGLINEVAGLFPQHRFVITSRPIVEAGEFASEFAKWSPVPGLDWVRELAEQRAIAVTAVDEVLDDMPALRDLVTVPIFAVALLDLLELGEEIPHTALELVCSLADGDHVKDRRIPANRAALRLWLDRVALQMEAAGVSEILKDDLVQSILTQGINEIPSDDAFIDDLATRAMLVETSGMVRFPANVIQEARAARALLHAGDRGLSLLKEFALVEVDSTDMECVRSIRSVRPSWSNTLDLLISSAPPRAFLDEIARYDECLVARSTPSTADQADRDKAVWTIWRTYAARRVWFTSTAGTGTNASDAQAIQRLTQLSVPGGFTDEIRAALRSKEHTHRGNAQQVLPNVLHGNELMEAIAMGIEDSDSVVRRMAAMAAWQTHRIQPDLKLEGIAELLLRQVSRDPDSMAIQTLITVAIDLAKPEDLYEIALSAPDGARAHAFEEVLRRVGRTRFLMMARESVSSPDQALAALLDYQSRREMNSWSLQDIILLVSMVASTPSSSALHGMALKTLLAHPEAAFVARVSLSGDSEATGFLMRMAMRIPRPRLILLREALNDSEAMSREPFSRLGSDADPDEAVVRIAKDAVARALAVSIGEASEAQVNAPLAAELAEASPAVEYLELPDWESCLTGRGPLGSQDRIATASRRGRHVVDSRTGGSFGLTRCGGARTGSGGVACQKLE